MAQDPKQLVAQANRMLYMEGLVSYSGHVSMRDPERDVVHINPLQTARGEIRPEDVVEVTLDSEPVDPDAPKPVGEREIHTALYRTRDDVNAVLHIHPPAATLFGITGTELQPVHIRGSILSDGPVPVLERPDKITTREDSDRMLAAMGDRNQLLIRSHGAVVADSSMKRVFARAIYMEKNAEYQLNASALGNPNPLTEEETERIAGQNWKRSSIEKFWHFYEWKAKDGGYLPDEW